MFITDILLKQSYKYFIVNCLQQQNNNQSLSQDQLFQNASQKASRTDIRKHISRNKVNDLMMMTIYLITLVCRRNS